MRKTTMKRCIKTVEMQIDAKQLQKYTQNDHRDAKRTQRIKTTTKRCKKNYKETQDTKRLQRLKMAVKRCTTTTKSCKTNKRDSK